MDGWMGTGYVLMGAWVGGRELGEGFGLLFSSFRVMGEVRLTNGRSSARARGAHVLYFGGWCCRDGWGKVGWSFLAFSGSLTTLG